MDVVIRALVLYAFVVVVMRAMGRKELSELSSFELVMLVVLGDLIQQGVTGDDRSITGAMLAVTTIALLVVGSSYLTYRFQAVQPVLEGSPLLVVRDGRPLEDVLKTQRVGLDELKEAARTQGIDDLGQVRFGIMEPDGQFSFVVQPGPTRQQEAQGSEHRAE